MSRIDIERVTCDRCAKVEDLERGEARHTAWTELVVLKPREIAADLCHECFEGLCWWLDGNDAAMPQGMEDSRPPASRHGGLSTADLDRLKQMWADGKVGREIAEALGVQAPTIYRHARDMGLPRRPRGRQRSKFTPYYRPSGSQQRRHVSPSSGRSVRLPDEHGAVSEGRTLFPGTVVDVAASPRVLIEGHNQRKIGKTVMKGRWAGMPIYTLTLEERASCPSTCAVWNDCYGNNMPFARRHRHGAQLEERLHQELAAAQKRHPRGFVVRLHILGDFYSVPYVELWSAALKRLPALHVFGFTAHQLDTPIGDAVLRLNLDHVLRCRLRYSDAIDAGGMGAVVIDDPAAAGKAVICPAQTEKTDCCATCALCWTMDKPVSFLRHGEAVAATIQHEGNQP